MDAWLRQRTRASTAGLAQVAGLIGHWVLRLLQR